MGGSSWCIASAWQGFVGDAENLMYETLLADLDAQLLQQPSSTGRSPPPTRASKLKHLYPSMHPEYLLVVVVGMRAAGQACL